VQPRTRTQGRVDGIRRGSALDEQQVTDDVFEQMNGGLKR
jgi:hypothetical protein